MELIFAGACVIVIAVFASMAVKVHVDEKEVLLNRVSLLTQDAVRVNDLLRGEMSRLRAENERLSDQVFAILGDRWTIEKKRSEWYLQSLDKRPEPGGGGMFENHGIMKPDPVHDYSEPVAVEMPCPESALD